MIKDTKELASLFRNYKRNKARLRILELGLVSDDDYTLGSIDYSSDNVQTSNLATLDNRILAREREKEELSEKIAITEILLDSFDSRKDNQYEKLVVGYYVENKTQSEVMNDIGIYDNRYFFELCRKALASLLELI